MTETPKVPRFSRKPLDSSPEGVENTLPSGSDLVAPAIAEDVAAQFKIIVTGKATSPGRTGQNPLADAIQFIKNAADAPALYEAWLKFRNAYFNIVDRHGGDAHSAYDNASILLQRATQVMDEKIKTPTGNTPTTTANAPLQSDAVEIVLVRAQRYVINEFQKSAVPKKGAVYEKWNYLKDPSVWIEEVFFSKVNDFSFKKVKEEGVNVRVRPPKQYKTMPSFSHEKPQILLEAIDRIFLEVAKMRDVVLEFSFKDIQKGLVVSSSKSLKKLRDNHVVADLINQLGGKWEVHGFWVRKVRIVIPLKATFPPPSQPSQSGSGRIRHDQVPAVQSSQSNIGKVAGTASHASDAFKAAILSSPPGTLPLDYPEAYTAFPVGPQESALSLFR